jgi:hypothetical protein
MNFVSTNCDCKNISGDFLKNIFANFDYKKLKYVSLINFFSPLQIAIVRLFMTFFF